jgi:hypothetical protein
VAAFDRSRPKRISTSQAETWRASRIPHFIRHENTMVLLPMLTYARLSVRIGFALAGLHSDLILSGHEV